jgi:hypothetical protein
MLNVFSRRIPVCAQAVSFLTTEYQYMAVFMVRITVDRRLYAVQN